MLYDYECSKCHHKMMDVYQSIKDEALTLCPSCNTDNLSRIIYGGICSFVKDAKTIGQLADKNWSNLGHYQKSEIENKTKKDNDINKNKKATNIEINKMTKQQKERYIITGEK